MGRLRGRAAGYRSPVRGGILSLAGQQAASASIAFAAADGTLRLPGRGASGGGRIFVPTVRGRQRSRSSMALRFRYLGRQTSSSTIGLTGGGDTSFANGYSYRRRLLIPAQSDLTAATLSNFSTFLELTLNDLKSVGNGGKVRSASGWDIRVETEAAVKLDHEIDAYDPATGRLAIWIRLPSLNTAAAQRAVLYYGKVGLTASEEAVAGTWTGKAAAWRWPDGLDRSSNVRHLTLGDVAGGVEPYDRSDDYEPIVFGAVTSYAEGADQWQMTERADGVLLGHWGDNRGAFSTTTNRKTIGVSAVSGTPGALTGTDLWMVDEVVGGASPASYKGLAILAVGTTAFLYYGTVTPAAEDRKNTRVAISTNSGASFTLHPEIIFNRDGGDRLQVIGLLQLGAGYASGPALVDREYIYVYLNDRGNLVSDDLYGSPGGTGSDGGGTVYLGRVKIVGTLGASANARDRTKYSFFNGVDAEGDPTWTTTAPGIPVFVNPRGMGKFFSVSWVAALNRFVAGWNYNTDQVGVAHSETPWRGWKLLHFGPLATPVGADRDASQLFTAFPVARWCSATQIGLAVSGNPYDFLGTLTAPLEAVDDTEPPPAPAIWAGINHTTGTNPNATLTDASILAGIDMGVKAVRMGMDGVNGSTTTTAFNFTNRDIVVNKYVAAGFQIHSPVAPNYHTVGKGEANWKNFIGTVMNRYKNKIKYYIIGNEPNIGSTLKWTASESVLFTRWACEERDRLGLQGIVLIESPPPSKSDDNATTGYLRQMLDLGLANYCDVIGVHNYGSQIDDGRFEKTWDALIAVGVSKPVVVSECGMTEFYAPAGYAGGAALWRSRFFRSCYVQLRAKGVSYCLLFDLSGTKGNFDGDWSLTTITGSTFTRAEPSFTAIEESFGSAQPLTNAGFETSEDRYSNWWVRHSADSAAPAEIGRVTFESNAANARTGNGYLRFNLAGHTQNIVVRQVVAGLEVGKAYKVSVYARLTGGAATLKALGWNRTNGKAEVVDTDAVTGSWRLLEVTTPAITNPWLVIELRSQGTNTAGHEIRWDDASVVDGAPSAAAVVRDFADTSNVPLATLAPGATSATLLSSIGTPTRAGAARSGNSINLTATETGAVSYSVPFTILHDGVSTSAAITGTATKTAVAAGLPDGSYPAPTGSTTNVATMAALRSAYNAAGPGDRIVITADFTGTLSLSRSGSSTDPIVITGQGSGWSRQACGVSFQHTQASKWHVVTKLKLRQGYMMGGQDNYLYRCEFTEWSAGRAFGWGNGGSGAAKVTATRCRIGWTKFYSPTPYEPHSPGREQQRMAIRGDGGLDNSRDCWMFGIYVYDMPQKPDTSSSGYRSGQANAIEFGEGGPASAGRINMRADRIRVELCREGSGVVDVKACAVTIKDITLANVNGRCDMRATNDCHITNLWFQDCTGGYSSACGGKDNSINGLTSRNSGGLKIAAGTVGSDSFAGNPASSKLACENFELDNFDCDVEVGYSYKDTYNIRAKATKLRGRIGGTVTYSHQEGSSPSTAGGTIPVSTKTVTRFQVTAAMVGPDATA